jgi:hypothetical protein
LTAMRKGVVHKLFQTENMYTSRKYTHRDRIVFRNLLISRVKDCSALFCCVEIYAMEGADELNAVVKIV